MVPLRQHVLVFGWGNPSRGDDALGPAVIAALEEEEHFQEGWPHLTLETDFQLQVEHALDCYDQDLLLFVDASVSAEEPFSFQEITAARDSSFSTHEMSPQAVLAVYHELQDTPPPPAFLLGIRGSSFELGDGLSEAADRNLQQAMVLIRELLARTDPSFWRSKASASL